MRSQMFSLALALATLTGVTAPASAQSPYSYPWCSRQTAGKERHDDLLFHELRAVHDDDLGHRRLVLPEPLLQRRAEFGTDVPSPALLI